MPSRPNVLLVTIDQLRGDSLGCTGHPLVRTPTLDALAAEGVRFARHYSQAAPCSPGRAALYTGTYQMNNRVVANGTPLDRRFDNVALMARRAGYAPAVFGYTDIGVDPRWVRDRDDPRLSTYEGILPGFDVGLELTGWAEPWLAWLADAHGLTFADADEALFSEGERHEDLSITTFLTDHLLAWIDRQDEPWFAHASYLRPHPPYAAAGRWATRYDPADCPPPVPVGDDPHPLHRTLMAHPILRAPEDPAAMAALRAQYYGMIGEVDHHLGRVLDHLRATGRWDDTIVVVTADHGEQLGDQGIVQKAGYYEASFHVPAIVRDPARPGAHGTVVDRFTENVDLFPTLCELLDQPAPVQCDGRALGSFLDGTVPERWRTAAHWEWDWRDVLIARDPGRAGQWRSLASAHLAVHRTEDLAYVHVGDGSWRCFDLRSDPTWRTTVQDPAVVLPAAQGLLDWQTTHLDRTLTGMLLVDGGIGSVPARQV